MTPSVLPTIPMPVVYIAGPYRGNNAWEIECNIRRAEEMALEVWRLDMAAMCPHTNTRFFQGTEPDALWLRGCLALLAKCDAVLFTPDWARSTGARVERDAAIELKLPIFYRLRDLDQWKRDMCAARWASEART